jgi:uncharacterized LabA/DUF88 family protein
MFTFVFIDWENIEKTAKQDFDSILNFAEFVKAIKEQATIENTRIVGIYAYGDFDKGTAGLMTSLVNLGIEPKHVVTKTFQEYLKGSTDIELSLDILETMYSLPHITDYMFVSGDSDLRYVIKRLKKQGKNLRLMGFEKNTSQFLIEIVDKFTKLEDFPQIIKKETPKEKETKLEVYKTDEYVHEVIKRVNTLEANEGNGFVGLNALMKRLKGENRENAIFLSEALTNCLSYGILITYQVDNPNDRKNPTTACRLNRENKVVKYVLDK